MKNKFVVIMLCALVMFVAKGAEANPDVQQVSNQFNNQSASNSAASSAAHSTSISGASASIENSIKAGASASAMGGAGGIGQGGLATNSGSQSVNIDQGQIRQSPSVFMNAPAPTAPCQATAGGFVSFIAGGGFAASYTLEECEIRESARIAHGVGQTAMAKEIICMGKFAKLTASCARE